MGLVEVPPRTTGVYQILCIASGKIYVGSAVDIRQRWAQHRRLLRRNKHHNQHLQQAWNRYGETSFVFSILELTERDTLLSTEQQWIDKTRCFDSHVGYNIFSVAGSPGDAFAQTWTGFIDPSGNEVTIINLFSFCREHRLDFPSMHRLANGTSKLKSYQGWSHQNSVRKRPYVKTYHGFVDPNGAIVEPITNLAAFCRDHGLDKTHMVAVAHGRITSHRGWTYNTGRKRVQRPLYNGFVDPEGRRVSIENLAAFCREHGLSTVHMHNVKSGKRKSHKGWTWRGEENNDS
jgi:predicted GIY-YIG superfamily endonuclease